jgi:hypothetical protein
MDGVKMQVAVVQLRLQERGEAIGNLAEATQDTARSAESFASYSRMLKERRQIDNEEDWFDCCCWWCIYFSPHSEDGNEDEEDVQ